MAKKRGLPAPTERQTQVLERLDRRVPIKVIAAELAISESRVNQHVRALKQVFSARDLSDLVARYRAAADAPAESPFRKAAGRKNHLPAGAEAMHPTHRIAPGDLVLSDAQPLPLDAPWVTAREPRVVPGVLDGNHAVVRRLGVMVGMAAGMVAAVILTISAAVTIGDLLDGVADVPVDRTGPSG